MCPFLSRTAPPGKCRVEPSPVKVKSKRIPFVPKESECNSCCLLLVQVSWQWVQTPDLHYLSTCAETTQNFTLQGILKIKSFQMFWIWRVGSNKSYSISPFLAMWNFLCSFWPCSFSLFHATLYTFHYHQLGFPVTVPVQIPCAQRCFSVTSDFLQ